jgi:hypothetical protein
MKNKIALLVLVLLVVMAAESLQPAIAQDNTPTNPAAKGTPVRSMIELGSVYTNIYDITITVFETVRGKEAMDRLKAASPDVKEPASGSDYVLARVKFELKGRYVSDTIPLDIGKDPLQWVSLSGTDLTENGRVSVKVPKPALEGRVKPGESIEGWLAFGVKQNDSKPVMVFDPDTGGATGRGKTVFFKLYQ